MKVVLKHHELIIVFRMTLKLWAKLLSEPCQWVSVHVQVPNTNWESSSSKCDWESERNGITNQSQPVTRKQPTFNNIHQPVIILPHPNMFSIIKNTSQTFPWIWGSLKPGFIPEISSGYVAPVSWQHEGGPKVASFRWSGSQQTPGLRSSLSAIDGRHMAVKNMGPWRHFPPISVFWRQFLWKYGDQHGSRIYAEPSTVAML